MTNYEVNQEALRLAFAFYEDADEEVVPKDIVLAAGVFRDFLNQKEEEQKPTCVKKSDMIMLTTGGNGREKQENNRYDPVLFLPFSASPDPIKRYINRQLSYKLRCFIERKFSCLFYLLCASEEMFTAHRGVGPVRCHALKEYILSCAQKLFSPEISNTYKLYIKNRGTSECFIPEGYQKKIVECAIPENTKDIFCENNIFFKIVPITETER